MTKKRVIFYVDGFNFYYGLKGIVKLKPDWRKFYWINFNDLLSQFVKEDEELVLVRYFTARPKNKGKTARQNVLMDVNKKLSGDKLKIHYGRYSDKTMICRASHGCGKEYMHWEEKETDVNLAVKMIEDCYNNICDKVVLVSADSDFLPPLRLIKNIHKDVEQMILFPPTQFASPLENFGCTVLDMGGYKPRWNKSILDDEVIIGEKKYEKPVEWNLKV
jgi:uncharacterized LabA/DUF88 family protein